MNPFLDILGNERKVDPALIKHYEDAVKAERHTEKIKLAGTWEPYGVNSMEFDFAFMEGRQKAARKILQDMTPEEVEREIMASHGVKPEFIGTKKKSYGMIEYEANKEEFHRYINGLRQY